jgi:hypothetical protein
MIALYALWCGFCWLLRGGKFGAIWRSLFKREPGTTVTRIGCAILMGAPLGFIDPAFALVIPLIYGAMTIGYFGESMAVNDWRERGLMGAWGVVVLAVMLSPFAYFVGLSSLAYSAIGALSVVAYAANKPFGRRLNTDWTERAEFCTGAIFGAAIYLAT